VTFTVQPLAELPDVLVVTPKVFSDERGVFFESWHAEKFAELGFDEPFVQDNQSVSGSGVLRGLHYQLPPMAQGKLVRVVVGEVFDVAVDIRRSSPTFGRWAAHRLSAANREMLWLPAGFAHGFSVVGSGAVMVYKCTAPYSAPHERTILWNDPQIDVAWPAGDGTGAQVSSKDRAGLPLRVAELYP